MSFIEERKALTREKRISTISNYNGTLSGLLDESSGDEMKQKIRTLSQATDDEVIFASKILGKIKDAVVVIHGAIGCAASEIANHENYKTTWYSTNLGERDTILGGDEKLRKAVTRAVNEAHAKVIFVLGTPVVAINNDDINSIILELEDELDVKIISIYTDGFKSKAAVTGYDIVTHSILKYLIDNPNCQKAEEEEYINLISYSENIYDIKSIISRLDEVGIKYNLLPQFSSVENIKKVSSAKASIVLNDDEGGYLAQELEQVYGIPYIKTPVPIGIQGTRRFFLKLSKYFRVEDKMHYILNKNEEETNRLLKDKQLFGKRIFLSETPSRLLGLVELVERLGGEVAGFQIPYIDNESKEKIKKLSHLNPGIIAVVGTGQGFELSNIFSKNEIDYFITKNPNTSFLAEYDVIPVGIEEIGIYGYQGIESIIKAITRAGFFYIKKDGFLKESWLKKSSNWYVKQEVR